jgi:NAD+ diphosphatase
MSSAATSSAATSSAATNSAWPESAPADRGTLHYTRLSLDRAGGRRADPAWMRAQLERPDRKVLPLWRDECLVAAGQPVVLSGDRASRLPGGQPATVPRLSGSQPATAHGPAADELVFLGLSADGPLFALDLSELEREAALDLTGADDCADVRTLIAAVSRDEAGLLAYARGLLHWQRRQRFCGRCGGRCEPQEGGHLRVCADCGALHFPKIEPAIIVLVELPGEPRRCLLGRHQGAGPGRFSTLAGFVEIGESLEDAVRREVAEEAGVEVGAVRYQGSQAWPFPAGLMIGFRGIANSPDIAVDGAELADARWFTAAEVRARLGDHAAVPPYRVDSIGRLLIETWLAETAVTPETAR